MWYSLCFAARDNPVSLALMLSPGIFLAVYEMIRGPSRLLPVHARQKHIRLQTNTYLQHKNKTQ